MITIIDYKDVDVNLQHKIKQFINENNVFLNNVIVQAFLQDDKNKVLLIKAICSQDKRDSEKIDVEFKKFYFNIRFTSYISNTIYFNAINYDKRYRKISQRHPLTVDKSLQDGGESSLKDFIVDPKSEMDIEEMMKSPNIEDYITEPFLFDALKDLTPKQKQVIDLAYVNRLSDTEISKRLGKSQQAISKLHKKALEKISKYIRDEGGQEG